MKVFLLTILSLVFTPYFTQKEIEINFEMNNENPELEISQLRYYISSIQLTSNGKTTFTEATSYHLIDHNDSNSTSISLRLPEEIEYNELQFNIGIDSSKNMGGVHGGDLDPTNGMYWTWQSGYINFKLEGKIENKEISYHIGGFMYPNNTCRTTRLKISGKGSNYTLVVHPDELLQKVDYEKINHVMSPGVSANLIADQLPSIFTLK
ncbi:MAG: hypothetical protein H6599_03405 [Flavobacteriales bacterium]|nr:hypothetical protein [Flavobacteriales bacterium]